MSLSRVTVDGFRDRICRRPIHSAAWRSGSRRGSDFGYRPTEEEEKWLARDPVTTAAARLREMGITSADVGAMTQLVLSGATATQIRRGEDLIDVTVREFREGLLQ